MVLCYEKFPYYILALTSTAYVIIGGNAPPITTRLFRGCSPMTLAHKWVATQKCYALRQTKKDEIALALIRERFLRFMNTQVVADRIAKV